MNGRILRYITAVALLAAVGGCSNWVLGIIQSFGSSDGPKISTVAGNGTGGYLGDGGPATSAEIHQPYAVAVDASNSFYIADGLNSVIRKVDASGVITTVPATAGTLFNPAGVAVDPTTGDIYISDTGNQVVRRVTAGGTGSIVVGTGSIPATPTLSDPYGLAVDSSSGSLYIADMGNSRILRFAIGGGTVTTVAGISGVAGYSGDGGSATLAHLNYPAAVAVDASGNIYIADGLNFLIRKVDHATKFISTVAGNGTNGYSGDGGPATAAEIEQPYGVAVDSSGNLYISELNSVIRKVDAATGIIGTVAGNVHLGAGYGGDGNAATAAMLDEPWGLAIDSSGNLLIADFVNNRIRKVGFGK